MLANAPRAIASALTAVKVNIAAAANAAIKIGTAAFTSGNTADFTNSVTFTVTAEDGTTVRNYIINIPAYNAISNPYGIYTAKHLADVKNGLDKSFLLKNTIALPDKDAADAATATGISDYATAGWLPLGTSASAFTGIFDGGNFSINNFYVNRTAVESVGLFGKVGSGGTVKNLGVNGVITGTAATGINSNGRGNDQYTGILAGFNAGTIDKCYATGVSSSNSDSDSDSFAGGLAGRNDGGISNSYATGSVSATASVDDVNFSHAGGLVGINNNGSINNSYATGSVSASAVKVAFAGGLAGWNIDSRRGRISNSYATGSVSAAITRPSAYGAAVGAGGLAGYNGGALTNCYRNSGAVIKKNNVDAASSDAAAAGITSKSKAEMQTDAFKENLNGTGTVWGREDAKNDGLPYIIGVGAGK